MGDTTSNQGKAIVTQGTPHTAQNQGVVDMCVSSPPAQPVIKPFKNQIKSSQLAAGKTSQTKIANQSIMNQNTYIGPPSQGDQVPWITGQTSGMPHNNWIMADAWSPDVKTEGAFVIRTDDAQQQNANNSGGKMNGGSLDGDKTTVPEAAILKCTMDRVEGISTVKGAAIDLKKEAGGTVQSAATTRILYKKSSSAQKEDYIEILSGDVVEFESWRLEANNIAGDPAVDPPCGLEPRHTIWRIKRTGGGTETKEDEKDGKKYTLDASITKVSGSFTIAKNHAGDGGKGSWAFGGGAEHAGAPPDAKSSKDTDSVDVGAVWSFIKFWLNPCLVQVDAIACAGPKTSWVRIFPHPPIKMSLTVGEETNKTGNTKRKGNDFIDWMFSTLGKLRGLTDKIASIVGLIGHVQFEFQMFTGFKLELELAYKYCTKTLTTRDGDWRHLNNFVGFAWSLSISSAPLIKFGANVAIPVVALAAALFTGPGASLVVRGLRWIEDKIGRFDLNFKATLAVDLSFTGAVDQHEEGSFTGALAIKPEISVYLSLSLPRQGIWASAGSTLSGTVTFKNIQPPTTHFIRIDTSGELIFKVWAEAKVEGRWLWIGPKYEWSGRKEFVIFRYNCGFGHSDWIEKGKKATS